MGKFLILVVLLVAAYFYLTYDDGAAPPQTQEQSSESSETGGAESDPYAAFRAPPAATPRPATGGGRPPAAGVGSFEGRLRSVARSQGVVVKSFRQTGKEVRGSIEWGGNVATLGGDFMEALYRESGVFSVDVTPRPPYYDRQQRRFFRADFLVKLK